MPRAKSDKIKRAEVVAPDPAIAVASLSEQLYQDDPAGVVFFCSANYNPAALAAEFRQAFDCPVVGCTTAGEIGTRYQENGIVAASFARSDFCFHSRLIPSIERFDAEAAFKLGDSIRNELEISDDFNPEKMFAMVLLDGLSAMEEAVAANISTVLKGVPLVGGSAGNSTEFQETHIFANGDFYTGAGALILIESRPAFKTFKLQNFIPSQTDLIITKADPMTRTVSEINGGPAAEEYARTIGLETLQLNPEVFAAYPLMVEIGDQWYVRTIQKVNPDGGLTFYCAVDNGLVLVVAKGLGFVEHFEKAGKALAKEFSTVFCTIGFDCLRRRIDLFKTGKAGKIEATLARLKFVGFSSFGEQFNAIHVNQTLTGVVIGEA